jgi:hypothetical protein
MPEASPFLPLIVLFRLESIADWAPDAGSTRNEFNIEIFDQHCA